MSRHNPPRLEVGRTYQLDGRKRRWRLDAVDAETGKLVGVHINGTDAERLARRAEESLSAGGRVMSRTDQTRIDHANEARRAVSQTLGYAETDENTGALVGIAAVEAVLDLHAPEALEVLASDCATEECDHWDECPTETFMVCRHGPATRVKHRQGAMHWVIEGTSEGDTRPPWLLLPLDQLTRATLTVEELTKETDDE